ncbi:hypothetical protein [Okeania sp. SIO2B3]|uniref:hypothetical protein n=1 Tax=Okeania sp. SIO2B3 TaxID=2607784 RepID=UPI0013BF1D9F|nr:hypothetical protein [Okeania sp. SIO2B3]NET46741.1 hypothetical protein [Okeania sp. SIO2B3]
MKLIDMKQELANVGILPEQVKDEFGDLRLRATWEAAHGKYCCYQDLPIVRAIAEQTETNNIVAFIPPAPPAIVSPPASPPPLPEEENIPQTEPPISPQEERILPGDSRRAKSRSLPQKHLDLALVSSFRESVFGQQPVKYDESVVAAASSTLPQLWVSNTAKVKRLLTHSLSPPFQIGDSYTQNLKIRTPSTSKGSRSPPK